MTSEHDPLVERRRALRHKSFLRGMVAYNNGRNVADCLVRDFSPFGARLIFSAPIVTPDVLELHIPQKEQRLRIHVIWRNGTELGVAFAQPLAAESAAPAGADPVAATAGLAERVARLEAEIVSLKRMLKKMKTDGGPEYDVA